MCGFSNCVDCVRYMNDCDGDDSLLTYGKWEVDGHGFIEVFFRDSDEKWEFNLFNEDGKLIDGGVTSEDEEFDDIEELFLDIKSFWDWHGNYTRIR